MKTRIELYQGTYSQEREERKKKSNNINWNLFIYSQFWWVVFIKRKKPHKLQVHMIDIIYQTDTLN